MQTEYLNNYIIPENYSSDNTQDSNESNESVETTFEHCFNVESIKVNSFFVGTIKPKHSGKSSFKGVFKVLSKVFQNKKCIGVRVMRQDGKVFEVHPHAITFYKNSDAKKLIEKALSAFQKDTTKTTKTTTSVKPTTPTWSTNSFKELTTEDKIKTLITLNIKNIWLVGPAGCGKSTITRNIAKELDMPYYCISCGVGTSATEFIGYKYPQREATKFADYYSKKSIILIDEMTALDPSVAQILNSALANDEIETTTGLVKRHPECIIVATSNTFGNGADRQYVANNQLDSSTIDRFIGGIIEVDYSKEFESQYDSEVVEYVNYLRNVIKNNQLRRVCSTRMIQNISKIKASGYTDWKEVCTLNWTESEKSILVNTNTEYKEPKELFKAMLSNAS